MRVAQDEENGCGDEGNHLILSLRGSAESKDAVSRSIRSSMRVAIILTASLLVAAPAVAGSNPADDWGRVLRPSAGPPRVIGGPANGCIAGAAQLPPDGIGYRAIRLSRHRNYGHPETVAFVERLGKAAAQAGLAPFYVGDMAQPRGGPMTSGHAAHENGVDVDIWFNLDPKPALPPEAREEVELPSMVLSDHTDIDRGRFGENQVRLLRLAASDGHVDRIFVHPTIKRALCQGFGGAGDGDRSWLHRIRPWYGHDEHFHVRLSCPPGSPDCTGQSPVPAGDGCDASLDWWFTHPPAPAPTTPPPPRPSLPAACRALLSGE
jgi:penicillin-insensitive murein endopeptidase